MRMISCNGCRVLRKGCSEVCLIRPCLDWIKCPESQANATIFLAKFYGRAGLLNLIAAGPQSLRPAIFRSLLYDACGRVVNPVDGSAGLLRSGGWQLCEDAVEAVLRGEPINRTSPAYDIRHLNREGRFPGLGGVHGVRTPPRFKNPGGRTKRNVEAGSLGSGRLDTGLECDAIELELTLGFEPYKGGTKPSRTVGSGGVDSG